MNLDDDLLDLLPSRTQELVEVIGLPAALKLVELHGGRHIWVPTTAKETHWLNEQIGMDAFTKLCAHYSYSRLEIDKCATLIRALRDKTILEEFNHGMTNYQLATKYNTTERQIVRIRKHAIKTSATPTLDIFKDLLNLAN
jgi:hypothetical protein